MDADLVVIGAGALGLSTALHAALLGMRPVVVERHTAGSQASGRAAGLFKSVQADELRTWLARRSIELALTFPDWAGSELAVSRSGSFLIARTDQHKVYLQTEAGQSALWGVDVREAQPGELASRLSYYRNASNDGAGPELALWCPEDIYIEEPISLIRACLAAARVHGVELLESETVTGVTVSAGRVTGVETTGRSIAAPVVVDAAGAWTRQVAELAGGEVAVAPVRHQLLITEPVDAVNPADPIVRIVDAAVYLRPARDGLMAGGFEAAPLPLDPRTEASSFCTDDVPLDIGVLQAMTGQLAGEVPILSGAVMSGAVAEHRAGLFTMTPDGRFVTGPVPDVPGLWVASGCNGSGFSSSLAIGEALADWICGRDPRVDISALSPSRFGPVTDEALVKAGVWQYAHYYDASASDLA
jgi:glycine/D-amino acid oxidase-like deaminating enzyme